MAIKIERAYGPEGECYISRGGELFYDKADIEAARKEERDKYAQALERIINRAQLNTPGRTSKIVEIATDALQEKSNAYK